MSYRIDVKFLLTIGMILLLSACVASRQEVSAPIPRADTKLANIYVVRPGDNIYGIARQLNIPPRALIDANGLTPPYRILPGTTLFLPGDAGYVVAKGDTLLQVAHKTGVPFSTLVRINKLSPPYLLQPGQKLTLPTSSSEKGGQPKPAAVVSEVPSENSNKKASKKPSPQSPVSQPESVVPTASGATVKAEERPTIPSARKEVAAHVNPRSSKGFLWPAKGNVILGFGQNGKGVHNDGINIALPKGTPVKATDDGVIAYSGNELRGFGNLLLVKHSDGWMSAYAHNSNLLVKKGDTVHRGQVIAKSGDSGGVSQPQLHFELRQGTRATDPEGLLGKSSTGAAQGDQQDPG